MHGRTYESQMTHFPSHFSHSRPMAKNKKINCLGRYVISQRAVQLICTQIHSFRHLTLVPGTPFSHRYHSKNPSYALSPIVDRLCRMLCLRNPSTHVFRGPLHPVIINVSVSLVAGILFMCSKKPQVPTYLPKTQSSYDC